MLRMPKLQGTKIDFDWSNPTLTSPDRLFLNISGDPARSANYYVENFPKKPKNRQWSRDAESTADPRLPWTHLGWLLAQPLFIAPISSSQKVKATYHSISLQNLNACYHPCLMGLETCWALERMASVHHSFRGLREKFSFLYVEDAQKLNILEFWSRLIRPRAFSKPRRMC